MTNSPRRSVPRHLLMKCQQCTGVLPDDLVGQLCACLVEFQASPDVVARFVRRTMPSEDARELGRTCFGDRWADAFCRINETWRNQTTEIEPNLLRNHGGSGTGPEKESEREEARRTDERVCSPSGSVSASNAEMKKVRSSLAKSEEQRKALEKELDCQKGLVDDLQRKVQERDSQLERKAQDVFNLELVTKDLAMQLEATKQNAVLAEAKTNKIREQLDECLALLPADWRELDARLALEGEDPVRRRSVFLACAVFLDGLPVDGRQFISAFRALDEKISAAYGDDADGLKHKRELVQSLLNAQGMRYSVRWDLLGELYDSSVHMTDSQRGTQITKVLRAQVLDADGRTVSKAMVVTD